MRARKLLGFAPVSSKEINKKKQPEQIASLVGWNGARETLSLSQDTVVTKIEINTPSTRKNAILLKILESLVCCTCFVCTVSVNHGRNAAPGAELSDAALTQAFQDSLARSRTTE